jgi:NAD(P)-dependent dehydrogenase (short-subunit alcohol dehydrogenase family)
LIFHRIARELIFQPVGAATLRYLYNAGAKVVIGDFDTTAGEKTIASLSGGAHTPVFVQVDVSKYEDNLRLFRTALDTFGRIDHAIACAGITEKGKWFDPSLTVETVEKAETLQTVDVDFIGVAYFTRIAVVYLRHEREEGEDRSIVLISSAAGMRDSPGLFMYQVSGWLGWIVGGWC